jgi:lambda family phage portal protein
MLVKIFGYEFGKSKHQSTPVVNSIDDLSPMTYAGQQQFAPWQDSIYDGSKFAGGFGPTQLQHTDYWTLRKRSAQLFNENLYARGLIRRLVTNEINTGLTPEACPDENIIGLPEDSLNEWSENVENRFQLWAKSPKLCDWYHRSTYGSIQRQARSEALVSGDVLVVLRQSQTTGLPVVQLVSGDKIRTPVSTSTPGTLRKGHEIKHGVELDKQKRHVAFWVQQDDLRFKRLPANGEKSGRRLAWLVYGTDKRLDDVRGQPLLSIVLQSLKEIDRYRDSAQRKAVINSILAMFIEKSEDKMGTLPVSGGAVRRDQIETTGNDGEARKYNIASQIPGLVMEELQTGEKPVGFDSSGTDINFQQFESAILHSIAWANQVPPEILLLAFSNNYSASQAAINEFKIYLNMIWSHFGETFNTPIYIEWLISETLLGKIEAPGLLESWRTPTQYDVFAAWTNTEWYGSIKPSTDMLKQGKGSKMFVDEGWSTNAREARINTGTKFSKNIKRLKRENQLKAEAARPIAEFKKEFGLSPEEATDDITALIDDYLVEKGVSVDE